MLPGLLSKCPGLTDRCLKQYKVTTDHLKTGLDPASETSYKLYYFFPTVNIVQYATESSILFTL